jgi:hypothetical protein
MKSTCRLSSIKRLNTEMTTVKNHTTITDNWKGILSDNHRESPRITDNHTESHNKHRQLEGHSSLAQPRDEQQQQKYQQHHQQQ